MSGLFQNSKEAEVSAVECADVERVDEVTEVRGGEAFRPV